MVHMYRVVIHNLDTRLKVSWEGINNILHSIVICM